MRCQGKILHKIKSNLVTIQYESGYLRIHGLRDTLSCEHISDTSIDMKSCFTTSSQPRNCRDTRECQRGFSLCILAFPPSLLLFCLAKQFLIVIVGFHTSV